MLKMKSDKSYTIILAVILMMAMLLTSCSLKAEDDDPPSAPLLTVISVEKDAVNLAWSESYDNEGVESYKLYRDGDVLDEVDDTEYKDKDVTAGEEYEYYVVAYDEAGNRSSKSVKQRVKVTGEEPEEPKDDPKDKPTGEPQASLNIQKLSRSTVKIYTLNDNIEVYAQGSGTIVDPNGYILTNYHVVGDDKGLYNSDGYVAVAITDDIKKNIQPQYIAQYRSAVPDLDLAVVQIVADLNWNQISAADLNLVPAKITDSESVELGDNINILGYPGVGGETITFTAGRVSGFLDENNDSEVDWIKTDAIVNHGNSGGTAINGNGEMIGIPTAKLVAEDNDIMFYLRPVNLAAAVIEDAISQKGNPTLPGPSKPDPKPEKPAAGDGIAIYGRIVDSYTMEPIRGAAFVILKEGVTIEEFSNNPQDNMIQSYGETDRDGAFVCYDVPVGGLFSVIVGAEGYNPIIEDDALEIPSDWEGDMDIGDINLEPAQ